MPNSPRALSTTDEGGCPQRPTTKRRLSYIDFLRGLAVVFMFCWHTADSWLALDLRHGPAWGIIRDFGGLAAPLFFAVLGVVLALRFGSSKQAATSLLPKLALRGVELLLWGYLLQLQFWVIDWHALKLHHGLPIAATLLPAYVLLLSWLRGKSPSRRTLLCGLALLALSSIWLSDVDRNTLNWLFRVDVLQALGLGMLAAALLRTIFPAVASLRGALLTGGIVACLGPSLALVVEHSALSAHIPPAYLCNYFLPLPASLLGFKQGRFPLFPWLALVIAGMALGGVCQRALANNRKLRSGLTLLGIGAAIAAISSEHEPWVRAWLENAPLMLHPLRMLFRLGCVIGLTGLALSLPARPMRFGALVSYLGRHSLLLYYIHLELVFGTMARPLKLNLGYAQWALGFGLVTITMCLVPIAAQYAAGLWSRRPVWNVGSRLAGLMLGDRPLARN